MERAPCWLVAVELISSAPSVEVQVTLAEAGLIFFFPVVLLFVKTYEVCVCVCARKCSPLCVFRFHHHLAAHQILTSHLQQPVSVVVVERKTPRFYFFQIRK